MELLELVMDRWWPNKAVLASICCLPDHLFALRPLISRLGALVLGDMDLLCLFFPSNSSTESLSFLFNTMVDIF